VPHEVFKQLLIVLKLDLLQVHYIFVLLSGLLQLFLDLRLLVYGFAHCFYVTI